MSREQHIAVVGGGLPGMLYALYLARNRVDQVTLIEQQPRLGGLFASVAGPAGLVDQGIHVLYETGDARIDDMIRSVLPDSEWLVLAGVRKDIAGNFFRGRLNTGSIFPDARRLPGAQLDALLAFFGSLTPAVPGFADAPSLQQYFERRFGREIAQDLFEPIVQKVWRHNAAALSAWAARMVYMTRVVVADVEVAAALKKSPLLDQLVAWPDQLSLPTERLSGSLRGLYPKRFGMSNFVSALERALVTAGVKIRTGCRPAALEIDAQRVTHARLSAADGADSIAVSAVVWTTSLQPLAGLLGVRALPLSDPPLAARVVHLRLRAPPSMGELYYFYCYDDGYATFRVSNPAAYCPAAATAAGFPLAVELHYPPGEAANDETALRTATAETIRMGVVRAESDVRDAFVAPGSGAFPVPTLRNVGSMANTHREVTSAAPRNLHVVSPDPATGSFYLGDALRAGFPVVATLAAN